MENAENSPDSGNGASEEGRHTAKPDVFHISSRILQDLAALEDSALYLLSYVLLARNASGNKRLSPLDANAIASILGAPSAKVHQAMRRLEQAGVIEQTTDDSNGGEGQSSNDGKQRARGGGARVWCIKDGQLDTTIPYTLVDGNPSPLQKLYTDVTSPGANADQVDSLFVLLMLYHYDNMDKAGGVLPGYGLRRVWTDVSSALVRAQVMGTSWSLFDLVGEIADESDTAAIESMQHVDGRDERIRRFNKAFATLVKGKFVYQVMQVWSADPLVDASAASLYTLYVNDTSVQEPELQKEVMRAAFRLGLNDGYEGLGAAGYNNGVSLHVRYVAERQGGGYPIGLWRMRYKSLHDLEGELNRHEKWAHGLRMLHLSQD